MRLYKPTRIVIESAVCDSWITRNVLDALPDIPAEVVESTEALIEAAREERPALSRAKRYLILAAQKGAFFKHCPGGRGRLGIQNVCCDYFVINYASNCHMDCSYCYLQSYLNSPYPTVYANHTDLLEELEATFSSDRKRFFRVGTGELADSLALDPYTKYSVPLVEFFATQANAVLELKTKTGCVENLLALDHRGRTVLAWSVNPPRIQQTDEHKTATLAERLAAARKCVEAGYQLAFHFDPIVHYAGWETEYEKVVNQLFDAASPGQIAWISIGALRMTRVLKRILRERFPKSVLPLGELVPGEDGKLRYFKPLRVEMYKLMLGWIRKCDRRVPVYMCMEKPDVWQKVFKCVPANEAALREAICTCLR